MYIKKQQLLKKAMNKKLIIHLLILLVVFNLVSCSISFYKYPDFATAEYFTENYFESVPNLHYTSNIENHGIKYELPNGLAFSGYSFYKIRGVELNEYIYCTTSPGFMNGPGDSFILKHKDNPIFPIRDWDVDTICIYRNDMLVKKINDSDLYDSILNVVSVEDVNNDNYEYWYPLIKYPSGDLEKLSEPPMQTKNFNLRITFKQSKKFEWRAEIICIEEQYCLVRITRISCIDYSETDVFGGHEYYCYISEEFDTLMKKYDRE